MTEQEKFFSPNHLRLLNIAIWAKYLAWVALIVYTLWTIGVYFQEQSRFLYYQATGGLFQYDFIHYLKRVPSYAFGMLMEMAGIFVRGIMYFFVLKGLSLGLNMIVETDINYREQERGVE
jgi:hypothetical protein